MSKLGAILLVTGTLSLAGLTSCGEVVTNLSSIDDYLTWESFETQGTAPGHGDTIRVIYANEVARSHPHSGRYALGTVLVKEIYNKKSDGTRGNLSYLAVMRKLAETPGGALHDDWLFTSLDRLGEDEVYEAFCWNRCHVQAPIDGAWFDYGR